MFVDLFFVELLFLIFFGGEILKKRSCVKAKFRKRKKDREKERERIEK